MVKDALEAERNIRNNKRIKVQGWWVRVAEAGTALAITFEWGGTGIPGKKANDISTHSIAL